MLRPDLRHVEDKIPVSNPQYLAMRVPRASVVQDSRDINGRFLMDDGLPSPIIHQESSINICGWETHHALLKRPH